LAVQEKLFTAESAENAEKGFCISGVLSCPCS